jgi:molecular chaperone DnaK (HSP70)
MPCKRIGIDLGTTNSCVAVVEAGQARILTAPGSDERTMPSVIAQLVDGSIVVGEKAKAAQRPLYRHAFIKRFMASNVEFPFERGAKSPAEVSHYYLKELKERAEQALGGEVAAIVTVPAHFDSVSMNQTRLAASTAGLTLLGDLMREPVAAAVAYYDHQARQGRPQGDSTILVYDLGGGTMDATICIRRGDEIEVADGGRAYGGDPCLGGFDFDRALVGFAVNHLRERHKDLELRPRLDAPRPSPDDPLGLRVELMIEPWLWQLLVSAESVKIGLSSATMAEWDAQLAIGDRQVRLNLWVSRGDFEKAIEPEVDKTLLICDEAMLKYARARREWEGSGREETCRSVARSLDKVLLVGGSSRIPFVRRKVEEHFRVRYGAEVPVDLFEPDLCVALGAALAAAGASEVRVPFTLVPGRIGIEWTMPIQSSLTRSMQAHLPARGRLHGHSGEGWLVHMEIGGVSQSMPVEQDGTFMLPEFPVPEGESELRLSVLDSQGLVRQNESHRIVRAGVTVGETRLARPINIRLRDGMFELIPAGAMAGAPHMAKPLYIRDVQGEVVPVRIPLYDGPQPIGEEGLRFKTDRPVPSGTGIRLKSRYADDGIQVEARLEGYEDRPQTVTVRLKPVNMDYAKDSLIAEFVALERETDELLSQLPQHVDVVDVMRQTRNTLVLDLRLEFERPVAADLRRIGDRLERLRFLRVQLLSFQATPKGLRHRLDVVRSLIASGHYEADEPLSAEIAQYDRELSELERRPEEQIQREHLEALFAQMTDIIRRLRLPRERPPATEEMVAILEREIDDKLRTIRHALQGKPEAATQETLQELEDILRKKDEIRAEPRPDDRYQRLWQLDYEFLRPLHGQVVDRIANEGLLSSRP